MCSTDLRGEASAGLIQEQRSPIGEAPRTIADLWSCARRLHRDDDIPPFVSGFDIPVRLGHLLQRIAAIKYRFEPARLAELLEYEERFSPRVAFPALPPLPPVPTMVDADGWLPAYDGQTCVRRVQRDGQVMVAYRLYYVKTALAKQWVALRVDAAAGQFVVEVDGREVQRLHIKGLGVGRLPFATFVDRLCADIHVVARAVQVRAAHARVW
jgi:hypothetical protein